MKALLLFSISITLVVVLTVGSLFVHLKPQSASPQQKSEHEITFYKDKEALTECTATAVGPHALMTAQHCNEDGDATSLLIDLSLVHRRLLLGVLDGRDHVIYLIDGPAFKNYLDLRYLVNVKPIVAGEKVYIYGNGEGRYPGRYLNGYLDTKSQDADTSEVDKEMNLSWYTLPITRGDSGAAVFGSDGRVVGLITWGMAGHPDIDRPNESAGFALDYSEVVMKKIQEL